MCNDLSLSVSPSSSRSTCCSSAPSVPHPFCLIHPDALVGISSLMKNFHMDRLEIHETTAAGKKNNNVGLQQFCTQVSFNEHLQNVDKKDFTLSVEQSRSFLTIWYIVREGNGLYSPRGRWCSLWSLVPHKVSSHHCFFFSSSLLIKECRIYILKDIFMLWDDC